jgi:hypothetical protein
MFARAALFAHIQQTLFDVETIVPVGQRLCASAGIFIARETWSSVYRYYSNVRCRSQISDAELIAAV